MSRFERTPEVTRTIYGVTNALTSEGRKSNIDVPLRIELTDQNDRKIADSLRRIRSILPQNDEESFRTNVINITDQVIAPQLPEGYKMPDEVYVFVGPNRGLFNKDGSLLGRKNPKGRKFGTVEIVAPVFSGEADQSQARVIVRDEVMRGNPWNNDDDSVSFTADFIKQVGRDNKNIGAVVKPEHRSELVFQYWFSLTGDEKWIEPQESMDWALNYPFKRAQLEVRLENPGMPSGKLRSGK